jgi:hypothetical protein
MPIASLVGAKTDTMDSADTLVEDTQDAQVADTQVADTHCEAEDTTETGAEANGVYIMGLSVLSCLANIFKTPT